MQALNFETRKLQDTTRCVMVTLPKKFCNKLRLAGGDLVKLQLELQEYPEMDNNKRASRIVITKVDV